MSFVRYIDDNPEALQEQTLQTLYPGTTTGKSLTSVVPPQNAIAFVKKLAVGAKAVANANACGSLLAGQTSESDEHEDVGVWLAPGEYGAGHERDAIEGLGLKTWRTSKVMAPIMYSPVEMWNRPSPGHTFETRRVLPPAGDI